MTEDNSEVIKVYHSASRDMYYQEGIDYDCLYPKLMQDSKYKRTHIEQYKKQDGAIKIPLITHQIYYSYTSDKVSGLNLEHSVITTNKFNEAADFKHYIWTNDPDLIPDELKNIKGVEVHLISELANFRQFKEIKLSPDARESVSKPSNIIRIIVLREFGGIYHDLDYYLFNSKVLLESLKAFNFIAGWESEREYYSIGNAFIASSTHHPIMDEASRLIERNLNDNSSHPEYIRHSYNLFSNHLFKTGTCMFSIACYKGQNQNGNNDILLPEFFLYNRNYLWLISPESKNNNKKFNTTPTLIDYDEDGEVMHSYGADPMHGRWGKNLHAPIQYGSNTKIIGVLPSIWKMGEIDKATYPSKFPNCSDEIGGDYVSDIMGNSVEVFPTLDSA